MRYAGDLAALLHAASTGALASAAPPAFASDYALTVVMAANGSPAAPETGGAIHGIAAAEPGGVRVFHAGTARSDGQTAPAGGGLPHVPPTGRPLTTAQGPHPARGTRQ